MIKFQNLKVVLIGGSSHVGKSTLAQSIAAQLGWSYRSTDKLAKHPGRPWSTPPKSIPVHVAEHYSTLSPDELVTDVFRHYRDNVFPLLLALIATHATELTQEPLVVEGSAILPEMTATIRLENVRALWLTASDKLFAQRIYMTSEYETRSPEERKLIDQFTARTCRFNELLMVDVRRLGLLGIDVETPLHTNDLVAKCLSELTKEDSKLLRPLDVRQ